MPFFDWSAMEYDPNFRPLRRRDSEDDRDDVSYDSDRMFDAYMAERNRPKAHEPRGVTAQNISNLLGRVTSHGEFAFAGPACQLPILPGLSVSAFGGVSLPLRQAQAELLLEEQCRAEEEDNVWTLEPSQVRMTSPEWTQGLRVLSAISTDRLGFKGVSLGVGLTELYVVGAGGQLAIEAGDDREVAKLVVLFPSEYTGGDVVVFDNQTQQHTTFDMGKANGNAPLKPQYVVFAADVSCCVKLVTSGFLFMAVYALSLPVGCSTAGGKRPTDVLRQQLVQHLGKLKGLPEGESLTVALVNEEDRDAENARLAVVLHRYYDPDAIMEQGVGALRGRDRRRFQLLKEANALLPTGKQLTFHIAQIAGGGRAWGANQNMWWFLPGGKKLGGGSAVEWTRRLNVLNPDHKPLEKLDRSHGCRECFAIVAWPASANVVHTYELMGKVAATASFLEQGDSPNLQVLLNYVALQPELETTTRETHYGYAEAAYARNLQIVNDNAVPAELCQKLCNVLVDNGDFHFVSIFLAKYLPRVDKRETLTQPLAGLVRKFGWSPVGEALKLFIDGATVKDRMKLALDLALSLQDAPTAQSALTLFAVHKARAWAALDPLALTTCEDVSLLWKCATSCEDPQAFRDALSLFTPMRAELLGPVVAALAKSVFDWSAQEHQVGLASLASKRRQLLLAEMAEIGKPFAWQLLYPSFPDAFAISTFLRGPNGALAIQGFTGIAQARERAACIRKSIKAPIEVTAFGTGRNARVSVKKTGGVFAMNTPEMLAKKTEANNLTHILQAYAKGSPTTTGNKHPREEPEEEGAPAA